MDQSNNLFQGSFLDSKWFTPEFWFDKEVSIYSSLIESSIWLDILEIYRTILFFLALFFLTLMGYCAIRLLEIRKKEHNHTHHEIAEYAKKQKKREETKEELKEISQNPKWIKTLELLSSGNESDWKLAVIEADSILEDLFNQIGFVGETFGDKLKSADQTKFSKLTSAWEVHIIRNRIAHEGSSFELSFREAKRIIAIYESIFRDYGFI